jgi:hypothetical protein
VIGLSVLETGEGYAVGKAHGVLIFRASPTLRAAGIDHVKGVLAGGAPARGYMQIFEPVDRPPEVAADDRKAWIALAEQMKSIARAGALVVLQTGFPGAALRAAISGVMLLAKGRAPTRIAATVDEGAQFLVSERAIDESVDPKRLVDAATALVSAAPPRG